MADIKKLIQILNQKATQEGPGPKKVTQADIFKQHFGDLGETYGKVLTPVSGRTNSEAMFRTNPKLGDLFPAVSVVSKGNGKEFIVTDMYPNPGEDINNTATWTGLSETPKRLNPEEFRQLYNTEAISRQSYLTSEQAKRDTKREADKKLEKPMSDEKVAIINALLNQQRK